MALNAQFCNRDPYTFAVQVLQAHSWWEEDWIWENSQQESWTQLAVQGETSQGKLEMEHCYLLM